MLSETSLNIDDIDRLKKMNFDILYQNKIQHNQYVLLINQYKEQIIGAPRSVNKLAVARAAIEVLT
ncbi:MULTISPECIES: hypothetical protein [unclassified Candidatus Tisiphia]|uniref:hypothetical protein n=1 Tax=unclassified Candidatus Tisiphia TaxID=2996318 RepID=UPI00312CC159